MTFGRFALCMPRRTRWLSVGIVLVIIAASAGSSSGQDSSQKGYLDGFLDRVLQSTGIDSASEEAKQAKRLSLDWMNPLASSAQIQKDINDIRTHFQKLAGDSTGTDAAAGLQGKAAACGCDTCKAYSDPLEYALRIVVYDARTGTPMAGVNVDLEYCEDIVIAGSNGGVRPIGLKKSIITTDSRGVVGFPFTKVKNSYAIPWSFSVKPTDLPVVGTDSGSQASATGLWGTYYVAFGPREAMEKHGAVFEKSLKEFLAALQRAEKEGRYTDAKKESRSHAARTERHAVRPRSVDLWSGWAVDSTMTTNYRITFGDHPDGPRQREIRWRISRSDDRGCSFETQSTMKSGREQKTVVTLEAPTEDRREVLKVQDRDIECTVWVVKGRMEIEQSRTTWSRKLEWTLWWSDRFDVPLKLKLAASEAENQWEEHQEVTAASLDEELVRIAGTDYRCLKYQGSYETRGSTKSDSTLMNQSLWLSSQVPGGVVRRILKSKDTDTIHEDELKALDASKK